MPEQILKFVSFNTVKRFAASFCKTLLSAKKLKRGQDDRSNLTFYRSSVNIQPTAEKISISPFMKSQNADRHQFNPDKLVLSGQNGSNQFKPGKSMVNGLG